MKKIVTINIVIILLSLLITLVVGCQEQPSPQPVLLQAEFAASVDSGQAPLVVSFTNSSQNANEFQWDFGDGTTATTTATEELVTHEYTKVGSYQVTLTAIQAGEPPVFRTRRLTVTVQHGPLDRVKLRPETVELDIGQRQKFSVDEVVDAYNNPIPEAQLIWQTTGEVGTIVNGVLIAGTKAGSFGEGVVVTAKLDTHSAKATASVIIKPDPLELVRIAPVDVVAGEIQWLEAMATDQHGNRLSDVDTSWKMTDENAGSITETGLFIAGEVARYFSDSVEAEVRQGDIVRTAIASVNVTPGPLEQVVIAPSAAEIGMEMTQQFVAVGADRYGNRISGLTFNWSVENGGGSVEETGLFTAGDTPGIYGDTVKVETTQGSITRSATANVTVETDRILFISGSGKWKTDLLGQMYTTGQMDIHIMDADGSNIKRLTDTAVTEGKFSYFPDDRSIVYDSGDDYSKIMVMNADGSDKLCLIGGDASTDNHAPAWSPDGTRIVFSSYSHREKNSDICVMDADGGNLSQLTGTSDYDESAPAWSPDGTQIVFSFYSHEEEDSDICVMDADGITLTQITDTGRATYPAWSPDGTRIMFLSQGRIYVINTDGSNRKRLAYAGSDPVWSPDGSQIAFVSDDEIYVMNADGSNKRKLTSTSKLTADSGPAWSPDGSKIIFVSGVYSFLPTGIFLGKTLTQHERDNIYIMDADGKNKVRLTDDSVRAIMNPQWVPRKRGVEVTDDSIIIPNISTLKK